jgi:hypothetical protein
VCVCVCVCVCEGMAPIDTAVTIYLAGVFGGVGIKIKFWCPRFIRGP